MHTNGISLASSADSSVDLRRLSCGILCARQPECNPGFLSPPLVHFGCDSKNCRHSGRSPDSRCTHRAARLSHHPCVSLPVPLPSSTVPVHRSAVAFRRGSVAAFLLYPQFLRWQHAVSAKMRNAFRVWHAIVQQLLAHQKCPPLLRMYALKAIGVVASLAPRSSVGRTSADAQRSSGGSKPPARPFTH